MEQYGAVLSQWLYDYSVTILAISLITFSLITLTFILVTKGLRSEMTRYRLLLAESSTHTVEQMLYHQLEHLKQLQQNLEIYDQRVSKLEKQFPQALQKVGIVRYNAFGGSGGQMSFSLALLNEDNNGVVISVIQGREEGRTYIKSVQANGESGETLLSQEEKQAIHLAQSGQ